MFLSDYKYITIGECIELEEHYFNVICNGDKQIVEIEKKDISEVINGN